MMIIIRIIIFIFLIISLDRPLGILDLSSDVIPMAMNEDMKLTRDEALAALGLFDEVGLIVYREGVGEMSRSVFMEPQEIVNALRCFIKSKEHQGEDDWCFFFISNSLLFIFSSHR